MIVINGLSSISINDKPPVDCIAVIMDNPRHHKELLKELLQYEMHLRLSDQTPALKSEIASLRQELAPNIAALMPALLEYGLIAWGERSITAADPKDGVFPLVRELESIAFEPPSIGQCDRIKALFRQICELSGVGLLPEEAIALQAILDKGCQSSGPVSSKYLRFR